jgi:hypothetical protein
VYHAFGGCRQGLAANSVAILGASGKDAARARAI